MRQLANTFKFTTNTAKKTTTADQKKVIVMPAPPNAIPPKIPTTAETLFHLVNFIEEHKVALIGVECSSEEYEAAVQPAFDTLRAAGVLPLLTR